MQNSIRVRSATEYVIEVNDSGETISFDVSDTGLTTRLIGTFERINALAERYEVEAAELDKRADQPYNELITKNQYEAAALIDSFYSEARAAMDMFLGEGACRKIFGERNYYDMFGDLIKQLEPHFRQIGISAEKLKNRAVEKHSPGKQPKALT